MRVKDLLEKLAAVDPEAEVGHALDVAGPYVDKVTGAMSVRQGGRAYLVLETSSHAGTLFEMAGTDEVADL